MGDGDTRRGVLSLTKGHHAKITHRERSYEAAGRWWNFTNRAAAIHRKSDRKDHCEGKQACEST